MNSALMAQRHYSQRSWFKPKERSKQSRGKKKAYWPKPPAPRLMRKDCGKKKAKSKLNMNGYILLLETQHNHIGCWIEMEAFLTWVKNIGGPTLELRLEILLSQAKVMERCVYTIYIYISLSLLYTYISMLLPLSLTLSLHLSILLSIQRDVSMCT